jgi:peptidoglycan/LPS O-acetylase OafA/YrhL
VNKSPSPARAQDHGRIRQLDGIRALAILAVLIHHNFRTPLLWAGVDLFFVLSGFLISGILLARKDAGDGYFDYFYTRRACRILPPYIAVCIAAGLIFGFHKFTPWYIFVFFAMNLNGLFWPSYQLPLPFWSLAVEEQFYLGWPLVILFVSEKVLLRIALFIVLASPFIRAIATPFFPNHYFIYYLTPFRADLLCAGTVLAIFWRHRDAATESFLRRFGWTGTVFGFAVLALLQFSPRFHLGNNTPEANGLVYSLSLLGCVSLIGWSLVDEGWLTAFLTWRPLRFIGRISYTMYLVGSMVKVLVLRYVHNGYAAFALDLAGTILWATVSWYLLESPMMKLGSRFKFKRPVEKTSVAHSAQTAEATT